MARTAAKPKTSAEVQQEIDKVLIDLNAKQNLLQTLEHQKEELAVKEQANFLKDIIKAAHKNPGLAQSLIEIVDKATGENKRAYTSFIEPLRQKVNTTDASVDTPKQDNSPAHSQSDTQNLTKEQLEEIELERMLKEEEAAQNTNSQPTNESHTASSI